MRLIVKKELLAPLPPISMLRTILKGFGRAQIYVTTLLWGEWGENWVVSRIFAPNCRLPFFTNFLVLNNFHVINTSSLFLLLPLTDYLLS